MSASDLGPRLRTEGRAGKGWAYLSASHGRGRTLEARRPRLPHAAAGWLARPGAAPNGRCELVGYPPPLVGRLEAAHGPPAPPGCHARTPAPPLPPGCSTGTSHHLCCWEGGLAGQGRAVLRAVGKGEPRTPGWGRERRAGRDLASVIGGCGSGISGGRGIGSLAGAVSHGGEADPTVTAQLDCLSFILFSCIVGDYVSH